MSSDDDTASVVSTGNTGSQGQRSVPALSFADGWAWGVRYAQRTELGFMCKTDFDHELGHASGGSKVFPSLADLKCNLSCWEICGVVEVETRFVRVVVAEKRDRGARMEPKPAEPAPVVDTKDPIAEAYERGLETAATWHEDAQRRLAAGIGTTVRRQFHKDAARSIRSLKTGQTT